MQPTALPTAAPTALEWNCEEGKRYLGGDIVSMDGDEDEDGANEDIFEKVEDIAACQALCLRQAAAASSPAEACEAVVLRDGRCTLLTEKGSARTTDSSGHDEGAAHGTMSCHVASDVAGDDAHSLDKDGDDETDVLSAFLQSQVDAPDGPVQVPRPDVPASQGPMSTKQAEEREENDAEVLQEELVRERGENNGI